MNPAAPGALIACGDPRFTIADQQFMRCAGPLIDSFTYLGHYTLKMKRDGIAAA